MNTARLQALEALGASLTLEEQLVLIEHLTAHVRHSLGQVPASAASQPTLPGLPAPQAPGPVAHLSETSPYGSGRTALDWLDDWLATPDAMGPDWWEKFRRDIDGNPPTPGPPAGS